MNIGDKVQYSKAFLRSTGQFTGPIPFAKGIITNLLVLSKECILAEISWNDPSIPKRVNIKNLEKRR